MKARKPTRLKPYDYSNSGWYFVTICTYQHQERFGQIKNELMVLSELGKIAEKCWLDIPKHFPNCELDYYVIMPNHIHGIVIINNENQNLGNKKNVGGENFRPLHRTNLSNVIKGFKIGVKKWCNQNGYSDFKWQRSFYDRIIRNETELFNIRKYIEQNPLKWDLDKDIGNIYKRFLFQKY